MGFRITERIIKLLCGWSSFEQGLALLRQDSVERFDDGSGDGVIEATVRDRGRNEVSVRIDSDGDVEAGCTCTPYLMNGVYCAHIAAVLLHTAELESRGWSSSRSGSRSLLEPSANEPAEGVLTPRLFPEQGLSRIPGSADRDARLAGELLELFGGATAARSSGAGSYFDNRMPLAAEFILKPVILPSGKAVLAAEMKVGPKRPLIVQKIRDFLHRVHLGEPAAFTKQFIYDPAQHCFRREDDAVVRKLAQLSLNESVYRDAAGAHGASVRHTSGDRLLAIPPYFWDSLLPDLQSAPSVLIQQGDGLPVPFTVTDDPLPLGFSFDEGDGSGVALQVDGLDAVIPLDGYGMALARGRLHRLPPGEASRLAEMKDLLAASRRRRILIPPRQIGSFMDKALPALNRIGQVTVAPAVAERLVQTKLKARLFLDRVRDRLLAGLEFQYGDLVLNPLEDSARSGSSESAIVLRDSATENQILRLMDSSSFARTEGGYVMSDEDAEYDFLAHTVPKLEQLMDVYATTAVKARIFEPSVPPKLTVNFNDKRDWLEITFDMDGIREADIREVLRSLKEKRRYYKLPNGALMPLDTAELREMIDFMNGLGVYKADLKDGKIVLPVVKGLHLAGADQPLKAVKLGESFRRLLDHIRHPDSLAFPLPPSLGPVLRDYQRYGYQWLKTLAHYRCGGILADDMGLGKTLQTIAFLLSELPDIRSGGEPAIVVAPASLIYNWQRELHSFAPELRTVIADGSFNERNRVLKGSREADVIIASYPLLRRDIKLYQGLRFHTLILDEAQTIKNHATQTAQAVKELDARHRFALTGTPIENRLEDLWSIFGAVFPGLLPGKQAFHEMTRESIAKRVRPFMLRRLKTDVLTELPDKIESLQPSELLPEQKTLYTAYLAALQKEALKHLNDDDFARHKIRILAGLTRLRQICCHPGLFVEDYAGSSAKFEQLLELLEECRSSGRRVLVFSQFTSMLDLIGRELGRQGIPFFYLDGATPPKERVDLCARFNGGERDVFLISLKAGGTGLNLTGADTVILYDLWWNPAVEQQAADRAHRMGQKKVVQVIRLVAQGTVEDKMYELQQKKKDLIDEVVTPGQEALSSLSEQDIREILMV